MKKNASKEKYGKGWQHVYQKGKPALKNRRTGEVVIPSDAYVKKHHPRGPWDS
jgi:hypothetical protein